MPFLMPQSWIFCAPQRRGAFQGWRYFEPKDAPPDLRKGDKSGGDPELALELSRRGLI